MNIEMPDARWRELMRDESSLTAEEVGAGWHFCPEMDWLLANSNDPDGDCFCESNVYRNKPLTNS